MRHVPSSRSKPRPSRPSRTSFHPHLETLERRDVFAGDAFTFNSGFALGNSTDASAHGDAVELDAAGNKYVSGSFVGTVDFAPNADIPGDTLTALGFNDAFIAKYAPDDSLLWVRQLGGDNDGSELGADIAVDEVGNVYVVGDFSGTANFGSLSITALANRDGFVTKLDVNGDFKWVKSWGSQTYTRFISVDVDSVGNVYAGGYRTTERSWPPLTTQTFSVQKFSANGTRQWSYELSGNGSIEGVAANSSGEVFVSGYFNGSIDFDNSTKGTTTFSSPTTDRSGFVMKLSASGAFSWAKPFYSYQGTNVTLRNLALHSSTVLDVSFTDVQWC